MQAQAAGFTSRPPDRAPHGNRGERTMSDHDAMLAIQECLDGTEWNSNTLEEVAAIMTAAGYKIRDLDDVEREATP
jgi:hypothetical protein